MHHTHYQCPATCLCAAWEEFKDDQKEEREVKRAKGGASAAHGLTQQELLELQQKMFQEARARTLHDGGEGEGEGGRESQVQPQQHAGVE
jgi:hypothetical protein